MPLSVDRCEELGALRCPNLNLKASQVPGDEAGARDKGTRRGTLQRVHTPSPGTCDAKSSSSAFFLV